ncbi:MAG: hypothetical protein WC997_10085 [Porticoccaceae bacterium]
MSFAAAFGANISLERAGDPFCREVTDRVFDVGNCNCAQATEILCKKLEHL